MVQENVPLEEVFEHLKCTRKGLSSDAVKQRLDLFGFNKLEEKKVGLSLLPVSITHCFTSLFPELTFSALIYQESKILKFLGFMWNPLSWVMEAAAIMSIALANGGVRTFYNLDPSVYPND